MKRYNPKDIEPKWQKTWADNKIYEATETTDRPKRYILEYFPYPSGATMHVGHVRNYTIGDALTRFARMHGQNVLHPMGWDAFGLPAENYAIKTGISPQQAIQENTTTFKQQLIQMGFGYDWSREFASSDPDYYKWTQWFFLLLFKRGLAYQQDSPQWWCPIDKTVLANEQVENGRCWRCGSPVEKKTLRQWFFKITEYADRLDKDLDDVEWSHAIKTMQRNWIGRSEGAEIVWSVCDRDGKEDGITFKTFTTRKDTLPGVTFIVVAPESPMLDKLTAEDHKARVHSYRQDAERLTDIARQEEKTKSGVFTGKYAKNPFNGQVVPIYVANYVLAGYGTGVVMGMGGHDERDREFSLQHKLPVILTTQVPEEYEDLTMTKVWTGPGLQINSGEGYDGLNNRKASEAIFAKIKSDGKAEERVNYKIRDWLISRQRYWGAPIPIIHCLACGASELKGEHVTLSFYDAAVWEALKSRTKTVETRALNPEETGRYFGDVKDGLRAMNKQTQEELAFQVIETRQYKNLKALYADSEFAAAAMTTGSLPSYEEFEQSYAKLSPDYLDRIARNGLIAWRVAPIHKAVAVPEDQLPVRLPEVKSFEPSGDGRSPLALVLEFVHTTCPVCGAAAERETDTMDGFACSSWYFLRFADPHNEKKAFDQDKVKRWLPVDDYIGGAEHAVMHLLYARFWTKVMQDAGLIDFGEPFKKLRNQGMILAPDGQKMSKSKGNTIAPGELIDQGYGADAIRIMELFIGPWDQMTNWSVEGMGGSFRFLQRIWTLAQEYMQRGEGAAQADADDTELKQVVHRTVKRVNGDMERLGFNTAVAAMMEAVNELYRIKMTLSFTDAPETWQWALETLLQLLAPFAPHISEELWSQLGHADSIHTSTWPTYDEQYLTSNTMTIVVQVNGKVRSQLVLPADSNEAAVTEAAHADEKVVTFLAGKPIKKTIYIPGKIVSLVV
jgi:leucyl-tRNA synthetase